MDTCTDDSTCAPRYRCLDSTCRRVDCEIDEHCDPGEECTDNNRCVPKVTECADTTADRALYQAKAAGRDRVVIHGVSPVGPASDRGLDLVG